MPTISPNVFARPAANDASAGIPTGLREQVRRLERAHSVQRAGQSAVPLGLPAIDSLLPEGGLLTGALHEIEAGPASSSRIAAHDGAALGFAAHLLGRFTEAAERQQRPGTILWCRRQAGFVDAPLYAPALSAWFDPAYLLLVTARRDEDVFWAMEEGLRCPGMTAVLGETRTTDPVAGRRLSLAAEKAGVPALLLHSHLAAPQSVCVTRWRIVSAPSLPAPGMQDVGMPRWRIELRRNRFGAQAIMESPSWLVEWNDETHCLAVVPEALHRTSDSAGPERETSRLAG